MMMWLIAAAGLLCTPSGADAIKAPASSDVGAVARAAVLPSGGADFDRAMLTWSAKDEEAGAVEDVLGAPVRIGRLSSLFGVRPDPLGGGLKEHRGIDIPDPDGTPVVAAGNGVVTFAGWSRGYGNLVRIDHGSGSETRYAHLGTVTVSPGAVLRQGMVIGSVGSTGRSTGAHLHFEIRQDGSPVDPLSRIGQSTASMGMSIAPPATCPVPHWAGFSQDAADLPQPRLR